MSLVTNDIITQNRVRLDVNGVISGLVRVLYCDSMWKYRYMHYLKFCSGCVDILSTYTYIVHVPYTKIF